MYWQLSEQQPVFHLDGKAEDLDAHPAHVWSRHLPHKFSELVPVLIDLLHSQSTCSTETQSVSVCHMNISTMQDKQQYDGN